MCSLTLPPKTERECSYESSLSHNFLQETLCCQFFRGDIGGALQQIDLCFQQFLILLMLKVKGSKGSLAPLRRDSLGSFVLLGSTRMSSMTNLKNTSKLLQTTTQPVE